MEMKRLIDAMDTVTKISKAVTPLINAGCSDEWVCQRIYDKVLNCIADAPHSGCRGSSAVRKM